MSVAIAPMVSRACLDHHVISRAHRTARVRSHYLSPPSTVIPRGALPAAKGPRKVRRFPAPPMPATRRAADPSADACVWTDTEETCAVKSKALNTEQCGVPDDAGLNWNLLSESQCGESLFPYFLILFIYVRAIRVTTPCFSFHRCANLHQDVLRRQRAVQHDERLGHAKARPAHEASRS